MESTGKSTKGPIRVMILEDDPVTMELHCELINKENDMMVIEKVSNKESALNKATDVKPDVALLDINLTEKEDQHGIDVAIHFSIASPDTKVIMLSGLLNEDTVRSTMGLGVASNYILKTHPEKIIPAIRGAHQGIPMVEGTVIDFIIRDYQESLKATMTRLTAQHLKVLELFYRGYSVEEVADILKLEFQSVRNHQQAISKRCLGWKWRFKKLTTLELAQRAKVMGLF